LITSDNDCPAGMVAVTVMRGITGFDIGRSSRRSCCG